MRRSFRALLCLGAVSAVPAVAQVAKHASHEVDLAVSYNAQRRDLSSGGSFWEQGGSAELSADFYRGLGVTAIVSGGHASNIGGSTVNLTTVTTTAGPRYAWGRSRWVIFAEGTVGESSASNTVFPSGGGTTSAANVLAAEAGGGMDLRLSRRFAVRAFQASWLRTQFPNSSTNVQNTFQVGAGIVFRVHR